MFAILSPLFLIRRTTIVLNSERVKFYIFQDRALQGLRLVLLFEPSNRETTEKDDMSKQEFIKMFKAHGIEVSTRAEAGWALQFLNEKAPTGYRPKDIYLAWKADA